MQSPAIVAHALSTDLRVAIDAARRAGASGVALDPLIFPELVADSQTARREIINLFARAQQPPIAIDVRLGTAGLDPRGRADVEREVDRVASAIAVARGIGCPLICCDLGPLPPAPDEPASPKPAISAKQLGALILPDPPKVSAASRPTAPREPAFEANVDHALREIGARADRVGALVAFRASLASVAALAAALARVDCPWFGLDLDPAALLVDEWTPEELFRRLAGQIRHVRARDARRGAAGRSQPSELGAGQVEWSELVAFLRDADYRGPITDDPTDLPNRAASAARGIAFLRERLTR